MGERRRQRNQSKTPDSSLSRQTALQQSRPMSLQSAAGNRTTAELVDSLSGTSSGNSTQNQIESNDTSVPSANNELEEKSRWEEAGDWILGSIGGEFTDDPTYGQISADFVLSVIPYVDQAADARDLTAHIYRLGFRGEHKDKMRWVALAFSLIGLVPEIGSVIKSMSKLAIRFVGRNLSSMMSLVQRLLGMLPDSFSDLNGARRYIASHWNEWVKLGQKAWDVLLGKGTELVNKLAALIKRIGDVSDFILNLGKRFLIDRIEQLQRLSTQMLPDVFNQTRERIMAAMDNLTERFGPRKAVASGPSTSSIPSRTQPMQMSSLNKDGDIGKSISVEDLRPSYGEEIEEIRRKTIEEHQLRISPESELEDQIKDLSIVSRKKAGVSLEETHHIATRYRDKNIKILESVGLKVDDDLNLIKNFAEHGQMRGWYDWKNKVFRYKMKGHHPDYNHWVTEQLMQAAPTGLAPNQALDRVTGVLRKLEAIIRKHPGVLQYGPDILPPGLKNLVP